MKVDDALQFLMDQAAHHDNEAVRLLGHGKDEESKKHLSLKINLTAVHNLIEELDQNSSKRTSHLTVLPSELQGLPKELLSQLASVADKQEMQILAIMEEFGGTISIDRLLLEYYKRHNEILHRQKLTSKLYRMMKGKIIFGTGKGVYTLTDPETQKTSPSSSQAGEGP